VLFRPANSEHNTAVFRGYERTVEARKNVLGLEHPNTLWSTTCFAWAAFYLGYVEDALKAFEQIAETKKRIYGDEHLEVLATLNGIAWSYRGIGKRGKMCISLPRAHRSG